MWVVTTTVSVPPGTTNADLSCALEEAAVPVLEQLSGLRSATWTIADDRSTGMGFYVFHSEDAARQRAAGYVVGAAAPGGVTILDVGLFEVLVDVQR